MGLFGQINAVGQGAAAGVTNSAEFQRIVRLPRRVLDLTRVPDVTPLFARDAAEIRFRPIQSAMLCEAAFANGLFALVGVGRGKTLVSIALHTAMSATRTVVLVPAQAKRQTLEIELPKYRRSLQLPPVYTEPGREPGVYLVAHSELSIADKADWLERIQPDLIVADEAHRLRRKASARTKRFIRYMQEHPECRFCALSGSMAKRSIRDYAHLIEAALRKNSPLPRGYREVIEWAGALDVSPEEPCHPGILMSFCQPGEHVRDGFRRRLIETPGVVATEGDDLDSSLYIQRLDLMLPVEVERVRIQLEKTWSIGDEDFEDALALHRYLRQTACGFYYEWIWEHGRDEEWIEARKAWHREVRHYLQHAARPGMDSPLLLARAAAAGRWKSQAWAFWAAVKDRRPPTPSPVWISDFLVDAAIEWARAVSPSVTVQGDGRLSEGGAIVWYEHRALGERIATKGGLPLYDSSRDPAFSTDPVIVCSIKAHGEIKNLQRYSRNLITSPPSNGQTWEQLLGRTHRSGQPADEVWAFWFGHTAEYRAAFAAAVADARFIEETQSNRQKLCYATRI